MLLKDNTQKEKVIGLLGGMGPEATIDIFKKIVEATSAKEDSDHIRIIIDNNPKMPSRQDAILKNTESPAQMMSLTAQNLERAGADCIIICANTAHYFYDHVNNSVNIDVLNIIDETVNKTKEFNGDIKKVGVLATTGAMKANIFQNHFAKKKIEVIKIPNNLQSQIQDSIFSYKFNGQNEKDTQNLVEVVDFLINQGAEAIIMGCTEIPLMLHGREFAAPIFDPNDIIANIAVKYAKGLL